MGAPCGRHLSVRFGCKSIDELCVCCFRCRTCAVTALLAAGCATPTSSTSALASGEPATTLTMAGVYVKSCQVCAEPSLNFMTPSPNISLLRSHHLNSWITAQQVVDKPASPYKLCMTDPTSQNKVSTLHATIKEWTFGSDGTSCTIHPTQGWHHAPRCVLVGPV